MLPDVLAPVPLRTRAFYGIGAMPAMIVNNSIASFVLLYYNLVLGMPAPLVGTALAIALVIDGISDPVVGYASDRFRSRWGRRHPFMYLAIAPLGVCFYLLWNPPLDLLGPDGLFFYLLGVVTPIYLILTFFEVPHVALLPELTPDYDERSTLATYRQSAGQLGYTLLMLVVYGYFLRDTAEYENGLLNPAGYEEMGVAFALGVPLLMVLSAGGLHHLIPRLHGPARSAEVSAESVFQGARATFSDTSLLALLAASFLLYMAFGYYAAAFGYMYGYFWGLSTEQMSGMAVMWGISAVFTFLITPILARRFGKRTLALSMLTLAPAVTVAPVLLRLIGWFPGNDSPWLYPILMVHTIWDFFNLLVFMVMMLSMLADVIDQRAVATGRREEGIIYASYTFMIKAPSGAGVLIASLILSLIEFPSGVEVSEVPSQTLLGMGIAYVISQPLAMWLGVLALSRYRLTRTEQEATLEQLRTQEAEIQ
jgi:GPH family glycoside/pentoside/hexuronide:cation symporter